MMPSGPDGIMDTATHEAIKQFQRDRKLVIVHPGSVGQKTVAALNAVQLPAGANATTALPLAGNLPLPWLEEARRFLGLRESKGAGTNPTILKWLIGLGLPFRDDETAWCGTFVGWCVQASLPSEPRLANPAGSINWLKWGVKLDRAAVGCVGVFWRGKPDGWQGHVGFIVAETADAYQVLGGNQSDSVSLTWIAKSRLRPDGLRWPSSWTLPIVGVAQGVRTGSLSQNEA
jgi:uncharacterized protein (TIGR02594 family)